MKKKYQNLDLITLFSDVLKEQIDNTAVNKNYNVLDAKKIKEIKGYFVFISFPQYQPRLDSNPSEPEKKIATFTRAVLGGKDRKKYGATGHAIFIIVDEYGNAIFFEFGPYGKNKTGMTRERSLGQVIKNKHISKYDTNDFIKISSLAKNYTIGDTKNQTGNALVFKLPEPQKSLDWTRRNVYTKYAGYDFATGSDKKNPGGAANCATFGLDALQAGGIQVPDFCSPFPEHIYNKIKDKALFKFNV